MSWLSSCDAKDSRALGHIAARAHDPYPGLFYSPMVRTDLLLELIYKHHVRKEGDDSDSRI